MELITHNPLKERARRLMALVQSEPEHDCSSETFREAVEGVVACGDVGLFRELMTHPKRSEWVENRSEFVLNYISGQCITWWAQVTTYADQPVLLTSYEKYHSEILHNASRVLDYVLGFELPQTIDLWMEFFAIRVHSGISQADTVLDIFSRHGADPQRMLDRRLGVVRLEDDQAGRELLSQIKAMSEAVRIRQEAGLDELMLAKHPHTPLKM